MLVELFLGQEVGLGDHTDHAASPSMTGRAVTFHRSIAVAMSLKPVEGVTAMTLVVMTSATVYGVEVMAGSSS